MAVFERLKESLGRDGVGATLVKVYALVLDYWFDFRHGTDTCAGLELSDLTIKSENKDKGQAYRPTRVLPLRKFLAAIKPLLPKASVLVDFGSGKGRVLLVASEFGFREVHGVEFAHELCEIAETNCAASAAKSGTATRFRVVEADASKYPIQPDENVFFLYNPFAASIVAQVISNIAASLQAHPRKIFIAYLNPRCAQTVEQRTEFARLKEMNFWGNHFIVYASRD